MGRLGMDGESIGLAGGFHPQTGSVATGGLFRHTQYRQSNIVCFPVPRSVSDFNYKIMHVSAKHVHR